MNRQKIEQRIEILKTQKQSLELSMHDLDIAEYNEYERMIECDEARIEELQSLLDEPEGKDNITETIQNFLKNATNEELQKILKESDPDGVFAKIKDKVFSEQQPLDAPTHSGWWWVEGVEIPVEYRHETKTVRESESGYVQYLKDFQNDPPGKWLPANNPFGEEQL